jgi:hypothetical protein
MIVVTDVLVADGETIETREKYLLPSLARSQRIK